MNRAYIAGFVDGEGCIGFARARKSIYPRVIITNTNVKVLESIRKIYGGDIRPLSGRKANWKQGYSLRLTCDRAVGFLEHIYPWLRLKRNQAITIFLWDAIKLGRGKHSETKQNEYRGTCELLINQIKWLNQKGPQTREEPMAVELRSTA